MQRQGFWRRYARLISIQLSVRNRRSLDRDVTASPILIFTAGALFLILAILEVDRHHDELRALGLVSSEAGIDPIFLAP
jgi:hypothetical protein